MNRRNYKPRGPVPKRVKEWLEVNGNECWPCLVCDKCRRWVTSIDRLAPYHTELNLCRKCHPLLRPPVSPPSTP